MKKSEIRKIAKSLFQNFEDEDVEKKFFHSVGKLIKALVEDDKKYLNEIILKVRSDRNHKWKKEFAKREKEFTREEREKRKKENLDPKYRILSMEEIIKLLK